MPAASRSLRSWPPSSIRSTVGPLATSAALSSSWGSSPGCWTTLTIAPARHSSAHVPPRHASHLLRPDLRTAIDLRAMPTATRSRRTARSEHAITWYAHYRQRCDRTVTFFSAATGQARSSNSPFLTPARNAAISARGVDQCRALPGCARVPHARPGRPAARLPRRSCRSGCWRCSCAIPRFPRTSACHAIHDLHVLSRVSLSATLTLQMHVHLHRTAAA